MQTRRAFVAVVPAAVIVAACGGWFDQGMPPPGSVATAASTPADTASAPVATVAPTASAAPTVSATAATPDAGPDDAAPAAAPAAAKGNIAGIVTSVPPAAARNAVIYLEDGTKDPPVNAEVDNAQMNFLPYVAVVTAGGHVKFVNGDPFPHNVFSPDNERFDLGQIAQHGYKVHNFAKPGVYTLLCNLHPNMKGYVVVVPSREFGKADSKGAFTIKDVAAGTYKITAWAPGMKPVTQSVTVAGDVSANLELHR